MSGGAPPSVERAFKKAASPFKKTGRATEAGLRGIVEGRFREAGKRLGEATLRGAVLGGALGTTAQLAQPGAAGGTLALGFAGGQLQKIRTGAAGRATEGIEAPALPTEAELEERERARRAGEIRRGETRGRGGRGQTILTRSTSQPSIIGG